MILLKVKEGWKRGVNHGWTTQSITGQERKARVRLESRYEEVTSNLCPA